MTNKVRCKYDGCKNFATNERTDYVGDILVRTEVCNTHDRRYDIILNEIMNLRDKGKI